MAGTGVSQPSCSAQAGVPSHRQIAQMYLLLHRNKAFRHATYGTALGAALVETFDCCSLQSLPVLRERVPKRDGENNQAYARRLRLELPQLTLPQISQLSGVKKSNLKQDPAFGELPADLAPIREQIPQLEGEKNQAYARRLHLARPQLTLRQISQLSGVTESNLKHDPAFRKMPANLASIRTQVPQLEGEKNQAYARRLHLVLPQLTLPQISQLSGVRESDLKRDPAFRKLSADLAHIREQVSQLESEKNQAYARRLHLALPQLTLPQISQLSGVTVNHLKEDPAFREMPAELAPIREQFPQFEGEKNQAYARRLHLAVQQLTLSQISQLSCVTESQLKQDPAFREMPADLALMLQQIPKLEGETNSAYARRLCLARPQLTLAQISLLSGVKESNLKRALALVHRQPLSTSVEPSVRLSGGLNRTASESRAEQPASPASAYL